MTGQFENIKMLFLHTCAVLTFLFISLPLQHNYQVELLIFPNLAFL